MSRFLNIIALGAVAASVGFASTSHAQIIDPQNQPVIPFPTAPPPPATPPLVVQPPPQMASPPKFQLQNTTPSRIDPPLSVQPKINQQPRESYSDRVQRCLDQGAAMGYGPNGRAAYSRSCANQ